MEAKKRLDHIDGIKGLCAFFVGLAHFLLMFKLDGYVGWGCLEEAAADPIRYYFAHFPYSILPNYHLPLYLFMGIISFIPAYKFWMSEGKTNFEKSVITRYFRFMPFTLVSCLLSVVFYKCSLYCFKDFAALTGNTWVAARENCDFSFLNALYEGLYGLFLHVGQLVSSLWCVYYLFLGSLLTYAFLALCGKIKHRIFAYAFMTVFLWHDPTYLCFVGGIIAADILCHKKSLCKKGILIFLFIIGILVSLFPHVLLPKWLPQQVLYTVSIIFILVSTSVLFSENKILTMKYLCWLGNESFSFIITHMFVLFSLNGYLYIMLKNNGISDAINFVLNIIVFYVVSIISTYIYGKILNPITNKISNKVMQIVN